MNSLDALQYHQPTSSHDETSVSPGTIDGAMVIGYLTAMVEQLPREDESAAILRAAIGVLTNGKASDTGDEANFEAWCKQFDVRHAEFADRLDSFLASVGVQPSQGRRSEHKST